MKQRTAATIDALSQRPQPTCRLAITPGEAS